MKKTVLLPFLLIALVLATMWYCFNIFPTTAPEGDQDQVIVPDRPPPPAIKTNTIPKPEQIITSRPKQTIPPPDHRAVTPILDSDTDNQKDHSLSYDEENTPHNKDIPFDLIEMFYDKLMQDNSQKCCEVDLKKLGDKFKIKAGTYSMGFAHKLMPQGDEVSRVAVAPLTVRVEEKDSFIFPTSIKNASTIYLDQEQQQALRTPIQDLRLKLPVCDQISFFAVRPLANAFPDLIWFCLHIVFLSPMKID